MKSVHESAVLKPRDPSIADSNAWPDFPLSHVEIFDSNTHELTSLLLANESTPVTITGKLENLPKDRLRYLHRSAEYPVTLEVTNVRTFSYGQYEEGDVALWAAGSAGWFELKPSRKYREVFQEMLNAVGVLYFLADAHRDLKRKDFPAADALLASFVQDPRHECASVEDGNDVLRKHRSFLIASMVKGAEGINWKTTPIFRHVKRLETTPTPAYDDTMQVDTPTAASMDDEENIHVRKAGKGKSSLRPRAAQLSLKSEGRRYSTSTGDISMVDSREESTISTPSESNTARNNKRKKDAQSRADRLAKRQKLDAQTQDDGSTVVLSPVTEPSENAAAEIPLPLKTTPLVPAPKIRRTKPEVQHLRIIEEPLPTFEAQGPDGIWRCPFDGCSQVVYGVKAEDSVTEGPKQLIKEHYKKHALESQAKLDLIYKEERPYLPVGNLVKRIREMAAMNKAGSTADKTGIGDRGQAVAGIKQMEYPEPIKQAAY